MLPYIWAIQARPTQLTPTGDWRIWLILAGRGWGKTRVCAEDVKEYGIARPKSRIAVVAATFQDARDTCVEGESGLLSVLPPSLIRTWNRSLGELILTNGTRYKLFSADEPQRLRGPQHHRAWCDELAAWKYPETFDMLMFGLRLGDDPRCVIATTPKPVQFLIELVERAGNPNDVHITRGRTYDNAANLAPAFMTEIIRKYENSRMGAQELDGALLLDTPGALWNRGMIDGGRIMAAPKLKRIVVGVDPATTDTATSDDTGIVVMGMGESGDLFVLEDASIHGSPKTWANAAITAFRKYHADCIVVEVNNGGDMVTETLHNLDPYVPVRPVHASRGKLTRAEPIAILYEQGRVHHVGYFGALESQMCTYVPGNKSPDNMDAMVWAATELTQNVPQPSYAYATRPAPLFSQQNKHV